MTGGASENVKHKLFRAKLLCVSFINILHVYCICYSFCFSIWHYMNAYVQWMHHSMWRLNILESELSQRPVNTSHRNLNIESYILSHPLHVLLHLWWFRHKIQRNWDKKKGEKEMQINQLAKNGKKNLRKMVRQQFKMKSTNEKRGINY